VATKLTFSTGFSDCLGIFPVSTIGTAAAICASWVLIILLKFNWFLRAEDKVSIFILILSKVYHWPKVFFSKICLFFLGPRQDLLKRIDLN
jgi:hypothetical protein